MIKHNNNGGCLSLINTLSGYSEYICVCVCVIIVTNGNLLKDYTTKLYNQ